MTRAAFAELFKRFFSALEGHAFDYFAYGGLSVAVWGAPRETVDVDAVVCLPPSEIMRIFGVLDEAGFTYPENAPTTTPIDGWLRASFQGRHADIALGWTPFDESALSRRQRVTLFGTEIWLVSAEDLILYKLVAHRHKDLGDVESVFARRARQLDVGYLRDWAAEIARGTGRFEVPRKLDELIESAGIEPRRRT